MKEFINYKDLKPYFSENIKKEQLVSLAYEINHIARQVLKIIKHEEKKLLEYKMLKKAKTKILAAQKALEQAKEGFSSGLFEALIEAPSDSQEHSDTFFSQCKQIINCIPEKKPSIYIQKRELENFIEILNLYCEKIDPNIGWYSYSDLDESYSGRFFFICKTILKTMDIEISERSIANYMNKASKNRNKIKNLNKS